MRCGESVKGWFLRRRRRRISECIIFLFVYRDESGIGVHCSYIPIRAITVYIYTYVHCYTMFVDEYYKRLICVTRELAHVFGGGVVVYMKTQAPPPSKTRPR